MSDTPASAPGVPDERLFRVIDRQFDHFERLVDLLNRREADDEAGRVLRQQAIKQMLDVGMALARELFKTAPTTRQPTDGDAAVLNAFIASLSATEATALFGVKGTPGILNGAQSIVLARVGFGDCASKILDELFPGGSAELSPEQMTAITAAIPPEKLLPILALLQERAKTTPATAEAPTKSTPSSAEADTDATKQ